MPEQSTQRPAAFTALATFIDHLLSNPQTAHLANGGIWTFRPGRMSGAEVEMVRHVDSDDPQAVLDLLSATLGGTFVPDGSAGSDHTWQKLSTKWHGSGVELKLATPGRTAEDQLRARVAELEAELAAKAATA